MRWLHLGPRGAGVLQIVLLTGLLLPQALLNGASLSLLFSEAARGRDSARSAGMYAIHILGAAGGALLTGFVLLRFLSLAGTVIVSAAFSLAAAGMVARKFGSILALPQLPSAPPGGPRGEPLVNIAIGLSGFCALLYAVVWMRLLQPVSGNSIWSTATLLAIFWIGLASGLALAAWWAPKARYPGHVLALIQLAMGASVVAGMFAIPLLPRWFVILYRQSADSPFVFLCAQAALYALVIFVPAVLMGGSFPVTLRCQAGGDFAPASILSRLLGMSMAGGLAGAIFGGVLLIPFIGLRGAVLLGVTINVALAALGAGWLTAWPRRQRMVVTGVTVSLAVVPFLVLPAWNPRHFAATSYASAGIISDYGVETQFAGLGMSRIQFYKEGPGATVIANSAGPTRVLFVDGRYQDEHRPTQILAAHVAMALGRSMRRAFVAGLGAGSAAHALLLYPSERIDIAELEPGVIQAFALFDGPNPRLRIQAADPRLALAAAAPQSYDLIYSAAPLSWNLGASKLTTRQYYGIARGRLSKSGVFVQPIEVSHLGWDAVQSLLRTFTGVFPEVLVLSAGPSASELILLGSDTPLKLDWEWIAQLYATPERNDQLLSQEISRGVLLSRILYGTTEARAAAGEAPENTDSDARLEFSALSNLYVNHAPENGPRLLSYAADPWKLVTGDLSREERQRALIEMVYTCILTRDFDRGLHYAGQLRETGDVHDGDRLMGDVLYATNRRDEAVACWRRSFKSNPKDAIVRSRLVNYYQLLRPDQRPKEFAAWSQTKSQTPARRSSRSRRRVAR
jgi:spermidine synthase